MKPASQRSARADPDAASLRAYARRLRERTAAERRDISRELHDTPAQLLTAAQMELNWIRLKLPADAQAIRLRLDNVITSLGKAGASIRGVMSRLSPKMLRDVGLSGALEWRALEFNRITGIPCALSLPPDLPHITPALSAVIYSIAEECLTALVTHPGQGIEIGLKRTGNRVVFFLRISGSEVSLMEGSVVDLTDIGERVRDAAGTFDVVSDSTFECSFPFHN